MVLRSSCRSEKGGQLVAAPNVEESVQLNALTIVLGGGEAQAGLGIEISIGLSCMILRPPGIVGFNYGSQLYPRVKDTLIKAFQYATIFCSFMFLLFKIFSPQIISAFGDADDLSLSQIAVTGMRIYGIMTAFVGMQMVGANFFQYIGKASSFELLKRFLEEKADNWKD